jgi:creatinine amidohydrolase/Fe(II)-dependent formamide hydrolase-like protein
MKNSIDNKNSIQSENALSRLLVIDHLIIGPVKIEKKRLTMPYQVVREDLIEVNELIYKYEEDVFEPHESSSINLASVIGSQVALNYGLFCKKITFDGLYDQTDVRMLTDMMENTSREVLVKKIYEPNIFLLPEVSDLPILQLKRYTQAKLSFVNSGFKEKKLEWEFWHLIPNKHCVLSSGGKDSLLSYGLLNEIGKDVFPIYGNESGRHWFTAVNAYRFMKEYDSSTGRVWMNSDRLFSWMLKQLPFIRKDFASVRADDYPIRMWTVAVFSFGVLPLLKKHKIGRIVIGDEYDSSQRSNYQGIHHYNGLYDQSRFFDEAMSRYFLKKGWSISQFSILRSLSEMLILKILVNRYPLLQQHQTSCHATHEKDGRMVPCGKCEKCRRIIGMMTALDANPGNCGYSEAQIKNGLESLKSKKVKQLGPDASHLFYMLAQKEILESNAKAHPEIMHLRFDKERSHIDGIPEDLRQPLFNIFMKYADGAVHRVDRKWESFDLLKDPEMKAPYSFEAEIPGHKKSMPSKVRKGTSRTKEFLWGHLTWEEAEGKTREVDTVLLPVGAIEQHGPHLPLDVDAFDAEFLAQKVAEACSEPKPLVLPLVPYGVSYHHDDFPGTISITNESMARYIYDIGMSVARQGIKKLIMINGHGDNAPTLNYAAQMINRDAGIFVCVDTGETSDVDIDPLTATQNDVHAGEIETSTTLAIRPELVHMDRARDSTLQFSNRYLNFSSRNHVPWYVQTKKISETGTMGDPTKATPEKGKKVWEIMIGHLVAFVEEIKRMDLKEIYQKRY